MNPYIQDKEAKPDNKENEKVTLKFKNEMGGAIIEEFCGLKPMLYSIKLPDG